MVLLWYLHLYGCRENCTKVVPYNDNFFALSKDALAAVDRYAANDNQPELLLANGFYQFAELLCAAAQPADLSGYDITFCFPPA